MMSWPFFVMFFWCSVLSWLLYDANYQLFLAPKFGVLVCISLGLSFFYCLSFAASKALKGENLFAKGLILLLPVLFILSAGQNTLGNFALSKRSLAPLKTGLSQTVSPDMTPSEKSNPDELMLVSIPQLLRNWDAYKDKRVIVEGLISNNVEGHDDLSAVFRYFITCCAADAIPVGLFIAREKENGPKNNDWVRVSGKVQMKKVDGYDSIFMDVEQLEKKQMPSKNAAYVY